MTNTGQSKRARANRRRMQREYTDHWEDRLPTVDKQEPYKKLGLPLVLMPFVLMFCGGCVVAAPTMSILFIALLCVSALGEAVIAKNKTESYWVVYRNQPLWKVGETKEEAVLRRKQDIAEVLVEDRYPEDYAGRIQCLVPIVQPRPSSAVELFSCEQMALTSSQVQLCWRREVKVTAGELEPVLFTDKYGAITELLRSKYTDEQVVAARKGDDELLTTILEDIQTFRRALPQTITHTGTGLYSVKAAPTNESEVQSGAVAGQVVTIVGTVAASPAFTGGYITNTDQAETRAIVSHTTNTATLEGDISGWLDGDVLEFYDSWSTVDAAGEQLLVDQGVTDYSATQEMRIYAGTYTEAINVGTMEPTGQYRWRWTVNASDSVTITNTGLGADLIELNDTECVEFNDMTLTNDNNDCLDMGGRGPFWFYGITCNGSANGIDVRGIVCYDCTFTDKVYAMRLSHTECVNCLFTDCAQAIYGGTMEGWRLRGCVFDTCSTSCAEANLLRDSRQEQSKYLFEAINCTAYNCAEFFTLSVREDSNPVSICVQNCIFHTVTTVYRADDAEATLVHQDCDYNTYFNVTNFAYLLGSNITTLGAWQSETDSQGYSPDANSVITDPDLNAPATGDMSLKAESDCIHAGVGSYATIPTGINAVAFDKWHPDKGAWSSGPGPNVAHAS